MKFDDAQQKQVSVRKKIFHESQDREDFSKENILDVKLYENIAVYLMKLNTKGNFKSIATLANNGTYPASWSIRVFYTNNTWNVQIAPHPDIDRTNIQIDLSEYTPANFISNLHFAQLKTTNKQEAEEAINFLINKFKDNKLCNIENCTKDNNYILNNSTDKYELPDYNEEKPDENLIKKFVQLYILLKTKPLSAEDENKLKYIATQKSTESSKEVLLSLSKKYLTQSERIKIAMKFVNEV